jgi:hypothetical protein
MLAVAACSIRKHCSMQKTQGEAQYQPLSQQHEHWPICQKLRFGFNWINDADLALVETQLIPIPSQPRLSSSANCSGVSMVCCRCFSDRHCDIQLAMEVKLLWLWMVVTSVVLYKANLNSNWCSYFLHLHTLSVYLALTFLHSLAS